jgi:hypothetical protein
MAGIAGIIGLTIAVVAGSLWSVNRNTVDAPEAAAMNETVPSAGDADQSPDVARMEAVRTVFLGVGRTNDRPNIR